MASNEITMPKLSDTMEEGKIIRWLKRPGDAVARGEALAEVETDKADMVVEAFEDGVFGEIKLKQGESAPVGAVIAVMRREGEAGAPQASREKPASEAQPAGNGSRVEAEAEAESQAESEETPAPEGPEFHPAMSANLAAGATAMVRPPRLAVVKSQAEPAPRADEPRFKASPLARRAAEEAGIDPRASPRHRPGRANHQARPRQLFARAADVSRAAAGLARQGRARLARGTFPDAQDDREPDGGLQARDSALLCHR